MLYGGPQTPVLPTWQLVWNPAGYPTPSLAGRVHGQTLLGFLISLPALCMGPEGTLAGGPGDPRRLLSHWILADNLHLPSLVEGLGLSPSLSPARYAQSAGENLTTTYETS